MKFRWSTNQRIGFAVLVGLCASVIMGMWFYNKHTLGKEFESRGLERTRYGFRDAVNKGNVEVVKLYLADGFSPDTRYYRSEQPILLAAAAANRLEVLRALIEEGAKVNAADAGGYQAIHLAAAEAHSEVLRELFKAGADPNALGKPTREGGAFVPIYHAAAASPWDISLSERERIGETKDRIETVKALLEHGARVNEYDRRPNGLDGPLHRAAQNGFDETVKLLLAHGAEVERVAGWDSTPLMMAASGGRARTVEILLAAGAQPNTRTQRGTALLLASHVCPEALQFLAPVQRCVETVRILLAAGADPRLTNAEGQTAYDVARDPAIVRLLKTMRSQDFKGWESLKPLVS